MFMPKFSPKLLLPTICVLTIATSAAAQNNLTAKANVVSPQPVRATPTETDRTRDGLAGPVRRVRTEVAKLSNANGHQAEDKRVVLETASYDIKGTKTENQYFPVAGATLTGKEIYKYDERGNISEMTLLNNDGTLLGKEVYKYDYDSVGNWTRMTTSVAVVEGGKVNFEPTEVTYRTIAYYLDENVLKMAQVTPPAESAQPPKVDPKPAAVSSPASKTAGNHTTTTALPPVTRAANASNNNPGAVLSSNNANAAPAASTAVAVDTPPPPANLPKPLLKPVSGGVLNGKAIYLPAPIDPEAAKRMHRGGTVTVEGVVDETGKVMSARATDGPAILRDVAIQAATKAKFSATTLSGQPVKVTGVINYKFAMAQ